MQLPWFLSLTNLGSTNVKFGFVEKKKKKEKKKYFLVKQCTHLVEGLKMFCSAHLVFGSFNGIFLCVGVLFLLDCCFVLLCFLSTQIHGKRRAWEWFAVTNTLFSE